MLIDTHEAVKKFVSVGIQEEHAEAITSVISNIDSKVATKGDIEKLETKIDIELKWLKLLMSIIIGLLVKVAFF